MKVSMLRLLSAAALVGCMISPALAQPSTSASPAQPAKPATPAAPAAPAPAVQPKPDAPKVDAPKPAVEKVSWVEVKTTLGTFVIQLDGEKAPLSSQNFLNYVNEGFYDGTIFHRVISTFMVQGGGFTEDMKEKTTHAPIKNEWQNGLKNKRGTVACARTQVADSATSQFFINVVDNGFLDQARDGAAYAVFGTVISGMDVVDKIKAAKTGMKGGMRDVPEVAVKIEKARKLTADEAAKVKKDDAGAPAAPASTPGPVIKPAPAAPAPSAAPAPKTAPKPSGG